MARIAGPATLAAMTERVGPYEIVGQIGRGGMAVVYLAEQPAVRRSVALKELAPFQAADPSLAGRFLQEAMVAGSLNHPNVVMVYDFLEHDGVPYIAMEYLEHGSLRPLVGQLTPAQIGGVLEGLLAGLSHAARKGIVHRDIKPENLLGPPRRGQDRRLRHRGSQAGSAAEILTAAGVTVGTPAYMAPEQAMAQEVGPWTDMYQTGVIAYELIAGRAPFPAEGGPMCGADEADRQPPEPLRYQRRPIRH